MRLLLTGGGTGGHVYPALSVLQALRTMTASAATPLDLLWVGSEGGMEAGLVTRAGVPFVGVPAGGVRGMDPVTLARNMGKLSQGYFQARGIVRQFHPDVVFATGGYVGVPVVLAGREIGTPSLVYLPDIEPGMAVKALARLVDRICVTSEASRPHLPADKVVATGYPVRYELNQPGDKAAARQALDLDTATPTLLIFGGSRGARRINQAALAAAERLAVLAQVIHVTGDLDAAQARDALAALPAAVQARYRVYAYLHGEMVDALRAADLVVSRAGAAILGEYPAVGVPALLVPLPIAGGHQWPNAELLVQAGAAVTVPDAELDGDRLAREVAAALGDPTMLAARAAAMARLAQPDAARRIGMELLSLAGARLALGGAA